MVVLRRIDVPYLSAAIFGIVALIASLTTGFIAGIRWEVVLIRSAVGAAVFAVLGFAALYVLKRWVPEVYEMFAALTRREPSDAAAVSAPAEPAADTSAGTAPEGESPAREPDGFQELDGEALAHYTSAQAKRRGVDTAAGKLGKHVIEKERLGRYEPKLMAQAVRTMMSRDRD